jgi:hypothetical protein
MPDYIDLLITDDDFSLDAGGIPQMVDGRDAIAQDLVHMIRETGLLVELVANRDPRKKAQNLLRITIEMDNDERIVPGTSAIEESDPGRFTLTATTVQYGDISLSVET